MAKGTLTPADAFAHALETHAPRFGVLLEEEHVGALREYFAILSQWNPRQHLVAPCTPEEFATRHVLESLLALPFIQTGAPMVDVGSGGGLPAIPCLITRPDIYATLVEASAKKSVFLREALRRVRRNERARVVAERFENLPPPECDVLTCRALERFAETLPALVNWGARASTFLFFGGEAIRESIEREGLRINAVPIPETERRFLFVITKNHQSNISIACNNGGMTEDEFEAATPGQDHTLQT